MKKILVFVGILILGVCFINISFADLTKQDSEEIRKIMREEIQDEVDNLDSKLSTRIDSVENSLSTKIDGVENSLSTKIDGVENSLNRWIEGLQNIMIAGFGVLFAGMFALFGFVLWDRRTALAPAVKKYKEIDEKEERVEKILKEYAQAEPRLAAILRNFSL
jgi:predicted PurR-regulated permease PerM